MSWAASPIQTPSKARRSYQSEYETAGEEDDSDSSLYYSMMDMDRTLENKENSLNVSSKSAKRLTKTGAAGTPLLRKTLQKNLVEVRASMTPQKTVGKLSFDAVQNDSHIDRNCQVAATTITPPEATHLTNAPNDTESEENASGVTDDACDVTVVETGAAAAATEAITIKQKSVSFFNGPVKVIVSDFDEPNKKPIQMVPSVYNGSKNKRLSIAVTKKTNKVANSNASVRNHRQQLAGDTKKIPTKTGRISISKRSSMYQPRKSSARRSIDKMNAAKVNRTLLEIEAAFADDSQATSSSANASKPINENLSTATKLAIASVTLPNQDKQPIATATATSIQNTKSNTGRKELTKKVAGTEHNQPRSMSFATNVAQGTSVTNAIKQSKISVAAARKSIVPVHKSIAPVRKSIAPRLSIFSTSTSSSVAARAQRRQTKSFFGAAKSEATTVKPAAATIKSSLPKPMAPPNSNDKASTSTTSSNKANEFVRPADVRRTIVGSEAGESFKCLQCKKICTTEFQLRIHTNNVHNLVKKPTASSTPSSNTLNASKCRFCDKQFDKMFALNKHMQENCTKIQPAERKRMFAEIADRNKSDAADLINESQSNRDGQPNNSTTVDETRLRLSRMSLGHSGVYRTPSKSIKCKICNAVFMSCVQFAEHSLLHGN